MPLTPGSYKKNPRLLPGLNIRLENENNFTQLRLSPGVRLLLQLSLLGRPPPRPAHIHTAGGQMPSKPSRRYLPEHLRSPISPGSPEFSVHKHSGINYFHR